MIIFHFYGFYLKRKRSRPAIERKPAGVDELIDLDDLLITKKMKRQRLKAMKELNERQQEYDHLFSQSSYICSQITICAHERNPLLPGNPEAFYLSGASPIEKPVLQAALQKLNMTSVHPNWAYAIAVQLAHR